MWTVRGPSQQPEHLPCAIFLLTTQSCEGVSSVRTCFLLGPSVGLPCTYSWH
jgi:hypothetical protein